MPLATDIADAVVAELNGVETWTTDFTAIRYIIPENDVDELETLHVGVIPAGIKTEKFSRNTFKNEVTIEIGVQKRLSNINENVEIDQLLVLVEEITLFLRNHNLTTYNNVSPIGVNNDPIVYMPHYQQKHIFTSVIQITYVVVNQNI